MWRYYSLTFRDATIWSFLLPGAVLVMGGPPKGWWYQQAPSFWRQNIPKMTPFFRWKSVRHFLRFADFLQLKFLSTYSTSKKKKQHIIFHDLPSEFPKCISCKKSIRSAPPALRQNLGNKVWGGKSVRSGPVRHPPPPLLSPNLGCKAGLGYPTKIIHGL